MNFCDECGSLLTAGRDTGQCGTCGSDLDGTASTDDSVSETETDGSGAQTELETLPTTSSGAVKKADAMQWLQRRDRPSSTNLKRAVMEKPSGFSGSTYPTDISTIRVTGDPSFIETVAGLFTWIVEMEDYSRYVEINLQQTEDRDTGEQTGNYALYLSVAERSGQ